MIATPLGRHAPALEAVRSLLAKSGRREQGRFAIEGATMLAEALAAGHEPLAVYGTQRGLAGLASVAGADAIGSERLFAIDDRTMARLSDLETPPGLLAVLPVRLASLDDVLSDGKPALVLAGVADPGNAGTLLRSAEIFGIRQAIFARESVEPHNPKVIRATMGAAFRMTVAVADAGDLVTSARTHGYEIVAATSDGTPLPEFRFAARTLVAIGNERHGVAWLTHYDRGITIPQRGEGESLNASVAGSIILYAFSQQDERKILQS